MSCTYDVGVMIVTEAGCMASRYGTRASRWFGSTALAVWVGETSESVLKALTAARSTLKYNPVGSRRMPIAGFAGDCWSARHGTVILKLRRPRWHYIYPYCARIDFELVTRMQALATDCKLAHPTYLSVWGLSRLPGVGEDRASFDGASLYGPSIQVNQVSASA
jgi:hypothetical protein